MGEAETNFSRVSAVVFAACAYCMIGPFLPIEV